MNKHAERRETSLGFVARPEGTRMDRQNHRGREKTPYSTHLHHLIVIQHVLTGRASIGRAYQLRKSREWQGGENECHNGRVAGDTRAPFSGHVKQNSTASSEERRVGCAWPAEGVEGRNTDSLGSGSSERGWRGQPF